MEKEKNNKITKIDLYTISLFVLQIFYLVTFVPFGYNALYKVNFSSTATLMYLSGLVLSSIAVIMIFSNLSTLANFSKNSDLEITEVMKRSIGILVVFIAVYFLSHIRI